MSLAKYLSDDAFQKYPADEYMQDSDIVVNSTGNGTLGRIGMFHDTDRISHGEIVPDSHVTVVRTVSEINTSFVYHVLKYYQPFLEKQGDGSTNQTELKPITIAKLLIPIPSTEEQNRIVAKLEETIPRIQEYDAKNEAIAKLNNVFPEQLKKSILQEAVQGKLVPQDPSDEPASILLERIREEKARLIKDGKIKKDKNESVIFRRDNSYYEKLNGVERCIDDEIPFEIPDTWKWVRWGTLSYSIQYGYNAPALEKGKIKMLRISDIQDNNVIWNTVPYCEIADADIEKYSLTEGDILFARTGGTVGKSFLLTSVIENAIYAGYLIRTRYNTKDLSSKYLKYFMDSPFYWEQLRGSTVATAQPNCNGQSLAKMLLPLPPLAEQHRIVAKIEQLLAMIKGL